MTIINATPAIYNLLIAGADLTEFLSEAQFQLNDAQADTAGLALISGTLVLRASTDLLNPITNTLLSIGGAVKLVEASNQQEVAAFGTSFITGLSYAEQDFTLTIATACRLSLLNFASTAEIGLCVANPESGEPKNTAIANLLETAGVPSQLINVSNIPGSIFEPVLVQETQSFISTAGQLAISEGYALYQSTDGSIIAEQVLLDRANKSTNALALLANELVRYESLPASSGLPPAKLKVTGNRLWPKNPRQVVETESESETGFGKRTETNTRSYNADARTAKETTKITEQIGVLTDLLDTTTASISRTTVIDEKYEAKPNQLVACDEPDEGRLLERVTTTKGTKAYWLLEFYQTKSAAFEDGQLNDFKFELLGTCVGEEITETWDYNTPDNPQICGSVNISQDGNITNSNNLPENFALKGHSIQYTKTTRRVYGSVLPFTGNNKLGRSPDIEDAELLVFPTKLIDAEETKSTWRLNGDGESWNLESETTVISYAIRPQGIQDLILKLDREEDNYIYTLSQIAIQARRKAVANSTTLTHTNASGGGRFPSATRYGKTPYKLDVKINAGADAVKQRTGSRRLSDQTPIEKADTFAGVILSRLWGQAYGKLIAMPASVLLGSDLSLLKPCEVEEPSGSLTCYELSGLSLSLTATQAVYASIGWLIGQKLGGSNAELTSVWANGIFATSTFVFADSTVKLANTGDLIVAEPSSLQFDNVLADSEPLEQELLPIDNFNAIDDILAPDGNLFEAIGIS